MEGNLNDVTENMLNNVSSKSSSFSFPLGENTRIYPSISHDGKEVGINCTRSVTDTIDVGAGVKYNSEGTKASVGVNVKWYKWLI